MARGRQDRYKGGRAPVLLLWPAEYIWTSRNNPRSSASERMVDNHLCQNHPKKLVKECRFSSPPSPPASVFAVLKEDTGICILARLPPPGKSKSPGSLRAADGNKSLVHSTSMAVRNHSTLADFSYCCLFLERFFSPPSLLGEIRPISQGPVQIQPLRSCLPCFLVPICKQL